MDKRQIVVVGAIFLAFFVAVYWAARLSNKGPTIKASTTLLARPGTMRDKAQMLTSKKKPAPEVPSGSPDDATGETVSNIRSMSQEAGGPPPSEEEEAAQEALNAVTPEEGIRKILAALSSLETSAKTAELYSALGVLCAQVIPPDIDRALAAFEVARRLAGSAELRHRVTEREAGMLVGQGRVENAEACIRKTIEADETATASRLRLLVLLGKLRADAGDAQGAETAYRTVMQQPVEALAPMGKEGVDVYRQACLQAVRLYRETGRSEDADKTTRAMKQYLVLLENP